MSAPDSHVDALLRFGTEVSKAAAKRGVTIDPAVVAAVAAGARTVGSLSQEGASKSGFLNRLRDGLRYVVSGVGPENWFGPWQPLPPFADREEQGTIGRQFDYDVGVNLKIQPRSTETITFPMLRGLADGYDLMRGAIETCKDQIESFDFEFVPKEEGAPASKYKDEIRVAMDFWERPDREHVWPQWLRMFVEDMLVLDAVAIFPTTSRGGELYSLGFVDGGTIKRVVDQYGQTPAPPDPAYQQVFKGMPAVDYTSEQLHYVVRNPRTWKLYGLSPVEQVIATVNIAIRRQMHQLQYYTEGNVPEALVCVPDNWTSKQIKDFQDWFDTLLAGDTAERRRMKFIPAAQQVIFPKAEAIKDEYDEWLAKIICWFFSISPAALIKQLNRASSEQIAETAKEEGQMPRMRFIGRQITFLTNQYLGLRNIKFAWKTNPALNPKEQAEVDQIYVREKIDTPDEIRTRRGKSPLTPEERETAWPTPAPLAPISGAAPGEETAQPSSSPPKGGAATEMGKSLAKATHRRTAVAVAVEKLEPRVSRAVNAALSRGARRLARRAATAYARKGGAPRKASGANDELIEAILNDLDVEVVSVEVIEALTPEIKSLFREASISGLAQVGLVATAEITSHLDAAALRYAESRGAELVTAISDTTRDYLRALVAEGVESGASPAELSSAVEDSFAFSKERSDTIARTELAVAHVQGNVEGWRESEEVVGKESILGDNHDIDDECDDNADAGVVGFDEPFPSGALFPPYHPNCVCDVVPVLRGET